MNASIVGGVAKPVTSEEVLELAFTKAQTLTIQTRDRDSFMAFSREGLNHASQRMKLSRYDALDGTNSSGLVLTFTQAPFTGTIFFASANPTLDANVVIWQVCENSYY